MKRRILSVLAAIAVAGGMLSACGENQEAGSGSTVTMWIYPVISDDAAHKKFWADQTATFKASHPDVEVKVEIYPWAKRDEALATAIASNTTPDVVYLIPDQLPGYAGKIEPIDGYLPAEAKADYLDNVRAAASQEGKLLAAPILTSAQPLICDQRAFKAIGETAYPTTWDEFLALGPKFKEKGIDLTNYSGSADATLNQSFYPLLWQAGGSVFNADGSAITFNDPAGVEALTFVKRLVDGGFVQKDLLTTQMPIEQTRLAKGKVACTWQNTPTEVEAFWGKENIVVKPPLSQKERVGYGTVGSLAMLKGAESKDAAGEWIKFATSPDVMKAYDTTSGYFSPKKSTGPLYPGDPVQTAMEQTVPMMTVGTLNPKSRQVMGALVPEIQAVLIGQKTPQDALDSAAKASAPLLSQR